MSEAPPSGDTPQTPPRPRRSAARWMVRLAVFGAAVAALLPRPDQSWYAALVPAASPFVSLDAVLVTGAIRWTVWLGAAVAVAALLRRRLFCRWMCPTGLCVDGVAALGRRCGRRPPRLPPLGQWAALVTVGGAVAGFPPLLWLDPLAIFSGAFNVFVARSVPGVFWSAVGLAAVLLLSALWPAAWCTHLCPLGALQDILARPLHAPKVATAAADRSATSAPEHGLSRRVVVGGCIGFVWGAVMRGARASPSSPLRPPGAVPESEFVGLCIRCGNCVRACPARIIAPAGGRHGLAGLLTPSLRFDRDYCRDDCSRCTDVCPTGALVPITPRDKLAAPLGFPRVDMDRCLLGDDRECSACRANCPYDAITYVFSESDYTLTPRVDAAKCPGCGACELACPTAPVKAIVVCPAAPRGRPDRS